MSFQDRINHCLYILFVSSAKTEIWLGLTFIFSPHFFIPTYTFMLSTFLLILPDFFLIGLGALLRHRLGFKGDFFNSAEKLVYYVLFPSLLFHSISQTTLQGEETFWLLAAVASVIGIGAIAGNIAKLVLRPNPLQHASLLQCAFRFNTYLALSLASALAGAKGSAVMAVFVGLGVPIVNVLAVHALAKNNNKNPYREILSNPLIIATILGLIWSFFALPIPGPLAITLNRLGACALAIGLLCVGACISVRALDGMQKLIAWFITVKLLVVPTGALVVGYLFNLSPLQAQMLLLFAALPTASSAHVLAARMGGNGELVATTMSIGTLIAAVTLPLWMQLSLYISPY